MALANLTVGADLDAAFRAETPAPLAVLKIRVTGTVIELDPEGGAAAAAAAEPSATLETVFAQLHAEAVAAKDAVEAAKRASMWLLRQGPGIEGKWTLLRCEHWGTVVDAWLYIAWLSFAVASRMTCIPRRR